MSESTPLRLIQIGAGGMGQAWLDLLTGSTELELVGLVDLDVELAASVLRARSLDGVVVGSSGPTASAEDRSSWHLSA